MKRALSVVLCFVFVLLSVPFSALPAAADTYGVYEYEIENGEATITRYTGDGGDVVIPSRLGGYAVTSIGYEAFNGCTSLTSITIPDSVTSIGEGAFYACYSLTSITIPDSVTNIGDFAFSDCTSLTSITIGNSVKSIGNHAFDWCESLTSVTIPDRVTSIGDNAFYQCTSLTSITIPGSVTNIGDYAFQDCKSLTSITVNKNNPVYHSSGNCIIETASKTLVVGCKNSVIPSDGSVTSIGDGAFEGCTSLTIITIPSSVTSIGEWAFHYCTRLTSITIPGSVTSIGKCAFNGCTNLTSITIPGSVTSIGDYAFYRCTSLTSVTIPDSVTSIDLWAFNNCTSLTTVYYTGTEEQWAAIEKEEGNDYLTDATIVYNYNSGSIGDTFNYLSTFTENNEVYDFYYEDAFFDHSAYEYDHQLARMSLCAAMASMGYYENVNHKGNENIKDLYGKIGIDPDSIYDHYRNPTADANSIGFIIGTKKISCPDGDYSLLAVTIRGGGYKDEWISNFTMGGSGDHEGFSKSAKVVLDCIKNYIENYSRWYGGELLPDLKVWINGYSRAGAVTNLTAAYLDNAVFKNEIPGLKLKDIYAYGFEVPKGRADFVGPKPVPEETYNNIFSIVNPNDLIPKLAPGSYGFGRYGITLELPTDRNIFMLSLDFDMYDDYYLPAMQAEYTKILKRLGTQEYDDELYGVRRRYDEYVYHSENRQPELYDLLVNDLAAAIGSREEFLDIQYALSHIACYAMYPDYAGRIDPIIIEIEDRFFHRDVVYTTKDSNNDGVPDKADTDWGHVIGALTFGDYTSLEIYMGTYHISLTVDQLKKLVSGISDYYYWATTTPASVNAVAMLIIYLLEWLPGVDMDIAAHNLLRQLSLTNIADSHYPELCLAWMNATNDLITAYKTRYLYIHCPVDVNVYDGGGELVASIVNDSVAVQGSGAVQAYVDAVGTKIFLLPDSEEYRVEVTATDNGEVDYSVAEYDHSAGMFTRYVDYKGITVNKGDNLNGKIDDLDKVAAPEYELRNTADKPIAAANDVQGAEANALALEDHSSLDRDISEFLDFFVPGDVNGNGKIDSKDYAMTKRAFLKTYTLTDEQLLRADINGNGKVDSSEYAMIKRHFLKTYVIPGAEGA